MAITVNDIHTKEFSRQVRGYSVEEVDEFLDELAGQLETLIRENRALQQQMEEQTNAAPVVEATPVVVAQPVPAVVPQAQQPALIDEPQYFRNLETTLRDTLLNAQRIADETISEARKKANDMVASAEEQAAAVIAAAKVETEAQRAAVEEMRTAVADYRTRFLHLVEDQVRVLKADETLLQ